MNTSYSEICREKARVIRDSNKFGGTMFDPTDPEYTDEERAQFAEADAFEALADLVQALEMQMPPMPDGVRLTTEGALEFLNPSLTMPVAASLAAGFNVVVNPHNGETE